MKTIAISAGTVLLLSFCSCSTTEELTAQNNLKCKTECCNVQSTCCPE